MTDVLIVGAGSAGSVLAERLSADPACRVTVLEDGPGPQDPVVRALTADARALPIDPGSPVARQYRTTLTDHPPRVAGIVRGACVGGSGAVNGGYFCRALPGDAAMLPGWPWAVIEEHYRAVETRLGAAPATDFGSVTTAFVTAARRAGHRWPADLATDSDGIAPVPLNIADGVRVGPGAAFLVPACSRPNLSVRTGVRVTRVRTAGGRAVGVDAVGAGGPVRIDADRVVLCAGAIATAQLLMLSGVGPVGELAGHGVEVIADLPVGQRCADHPEWVMAAGWPADAGRPVLEAVLVTGGLEIRPYTRGFGSGPVSVGVALMRPRARGRVSLRSADPTVAPRVEHRYDSEPADVAELDRGSQLVTEMLAATAAPGRPAWSTSQHLCGTAPMGAVVDDRCRVHGIDGLWVADGSVLARIPGRGPHATIAMLAHRAAEFIRP